MALVNQPPILASSFAVNGDKNTIPTTNSGTEGLASLSLGFPPITQQPVSQGGIPPQRADFNGIFNLITNFLMFIQNGSIFAYSSSLDYQPPAIVYGNNALYRCIATNGANTSAGVQPLSNTSYWQPLIPVGGITVSGNTITVTNETGTQIQYTIDTITNPPSQSDSSNKIVTSAWVKAYAPSKTGGGASGTWGINISGNAGTATKATQDSQGNTINTHYLSRNQTIKNDMNACTVEGIYRFSGTLSNAWTGTSWGTLLVLNNHYNGSSGANGTYLVQLAFPTDGKIWTRQRVNTGAWSSWLKVAHITDNVASATKATQDSDGNVINTTYVKKVNGTADGLTCVDDTFGGQLTVKRNSGNAATIKYTNTNNVNRYVGFTGSDKIMYKWGDNGADQTAFLDASNYNNYAPTKTGGGASGTWGINISGNAGTATKATQDSQGNTINTHYLSRNQTIKNDMNACTVEGIYRFSGTLSNAWTGTSWGTLLVLNNHYNGSSGANGTYLVQLAFPTDGKIWTRQRVNTGAWSSWLKVAHITDNVASATKATQDSDGNVINTTYVKGVTGSNATLTVTKGNGSTSSVTVNNVASATKATNDSSNRNIVNTYATKASPAFSGTPTAPTPKTSDNSTKLATTAFVKNNVVEIIKKVYPVGSIYMSTVSTNPATLFGFGTWEAMPAGRVLLAQGKSSWGTTYNAGSTGGEATHQLTVGELAAHSHTASSNTTGEHNHGINARAYNGADTAISYYESTNSDKTYYTNKAGGHSHTITVNNTGSNTAHNNMQPYIVCYIWKRSA